MKKFRFISLLLIVCMAFVLSGCNLFPQNYASYLNETVILIQYKDGNVIEVNRKDYLTAYNNYGAELINSNGYTEEQAEEATVNALVNRKILLAEAKELAKTEDAVKLQTKDIQELYYQTYEALISNVKDFESEIKKDWNEQDVSSMEEETAQGTVYTPYEKQAEVVYDSELGEYRIKKYEDESIPDRDKTFEKLDDVYTEYVANTINNSNNAYLREGYRRYLQTLQETQKALKTNYTDKELFEEEIKRIYNNLEENEYIAKYQDYKQFNGGYSTITIQRVLDKYKAMMYSSKSIYSVDESKYNSDMQSSRANVNYFINDEFFNVAHILIKFSDEQQAEYDHLKADSNDGKGGLISAEAYKAYEDNLYNNIKASVRDSETGEILEEDTISIQAVLAEIESALESATTNKQKDQVFRELMYKYNEDDGIMNADYAYIVGKNNSQMVENFTNASRELNEYGVYGTISGIVRSEYGVHIIYYMGECENVFNISDDVTISLKANYTLNDAPYSDVIPLTETYLNNLNNKTVFDLVYESLVKDNYSEYEEMNLDLIKEQKIEKITVKSNI